MAIYRVNVFKPGTGTITIWENVGGKRGDQVYKLDKIPLTPGPLVVVIKVAQSQAFNHSGPEPFWPPRVPDNVETIAASYVQPGAGGKVRLFNLSPDTKVRPAPNASPHSSGPLGNASACACVRRSQA